MALDDVLSASKAKLEAMLTSIDGGAGADVSFDDTFDRVKAEIEKLTSMSGGKVDWNTIASSCDEILSDKGKDFRVALYYAAARAHTDGLAGLLDGLVLLSELVATFWTTMGPPLKRPKARGNLCLWFAELCAPLFTAYQPTDRDRDLVKALEQVSRRVDAELADKLADAYGGMGPLRQILSNLVRSLPPEAPPPPPPRVEPVPAVMPIPVVQPPAIETVVAAPVQVVAADSGGGLSLEAIVDPNAAWGVISECSRALLRAGAVFREADASDANAYRVTRMGLWVEINQSPPAENGTTMVPSPPSYAKEHLDGLAGDGDDIGLIHVAEGMVSEFPLWLDPHRYVALALERLGYGSAKAAVLREVGVLLARAPELPSMLFNDGVPFAEPRTKEWIEVEVKPGLGAGGGGGGPKASPLEVKMNEARTMVANGALIEAVQLMMKVTSQAQTPVDRLRSRLALAQLCLQGEQFLVARAQLDGLDRLVEQHRLWEWEPELCSQFYSALYVAHRAMNMALGGEAPLELRAKETAAFERLCQLDVAAALKLTLGG